MRHSLLALVLTAPLLGASLCAASDAEAHGNHPHPPGEKTDHGPDEPPPRDAPLEEEGAAEKAKTTAPAPEPAADPKPGQPTLPMATGADENSWRPRTLEDSTWRRDVHKDESESETSRWVKPGHIHVELRFGPYSPNVDDDPAAGGAYAKYFGEDANFYFGLELDWLPVYIPYVGSIGPGFGWGVTPASGQTRLKGTDVEAASDTSLTVFPMYGVGVFRADGILRELHIPLVPYIKAGVGFAAWSVGGPNADTSATDPSGLSVGFHFALGGAIALNAFDQASAIAMYEATGIRYANIFAEWMRNDLGSDGDLLVGTSTFVVGLALDF